MTFKNYILRYITVSLLFVISHANAQRTEAYQYPPSEMVTIHSKVLNEDRKIYIHRPKSNSTNADERFRYCM
jgi:hypothetical protein